jgi:methionyl aminopeptidase
MIMVSIKNNKEIEKIRESSGKLALVMEEIAKNIKVGTSTLTLDKIAEEKIIELEGIPAFKNYGSDSGEPYPASICASLNSEIVHGIPAKNKILKEGDILKIDVGMKYKGMFSDMARTFAVGKISKKAREIIEITEKSFFEGAQKIKSGAMLSDYSKAVQKYVEKNGFSVVRDLVGHGIGVELHEDPQVMNYYDGFYEDLKLRAGMVLALEPMVNEGSHETFIENNGWVFKTKDGKLSAHYENTVLVTEKGYEILTK